MTSVIGNNTFCPPKLWTLLGTTHILESGPEEYCAAKTVERLWNKKLYVCKTIAEKTAEDIRTVKTIADIGIESRTWKKNYIRHWNSRFAHRQKRYKHWNRRTEHLQDYGRRK